MVNLRDHRDDDEHNQLMKQLRPWGLGNVVAVLHISKRKTKSGDRRNIDRNVRHHVHKQW